MINLSSIKHRKMFWAALSACFIAPSSSLAAKVVYSGVRWLGCSRDSLAMLADTETELNCYKTVLVFIGMFTPRQFINIFPVEKRYNSSKHGTKDYFSTMEALKEYGMDRLIDVNAAYLLWDYMNKDTRGFLIGYWNVLDEFQYMHDRNMSYTIELLGSQAVD